MSKTNALKVLVAGDRVSLLVICSQGMSYVSIREFTCKVFIVSVEE